MALGPTATILSFDLSQNENIQCVDIGHVDVEYLWYIKRAQKKEAISGKYINESSNDDYKSDNDNEYKHQIISKII